MKGRLGALFIGETQIGGVLDWSLDLLLADQVRDSAVFYKLAKWKLTAQSYWLFDIPGRAVIKLYSDEGYWEGTGIVTPGTRKIFDCLIHEPLEIVGEGVLQGKDERGDSLPTQKDLSQPQGNQGIIASSIQDNPQRSPLSGISR